MIGDVAYSEKEKIKYNKENQIKLVAKLNAIIIQGSLTNDDEFEFNKDAGMYVCKAGHLAIRKGRQGKKNTGSNRIPIILLSENVSVAQSESAIIRKERKLRRIQFP